MTNFKKEINKEKALKLIEGIQKFKEAVVDEADGKFKKTHEFITKDGKHALRSGKNETNGTWDHRHYEKTEKGWKHIKHHGYDGHSSKEEAAEAAKGDRDDYDSGKTYKESAEEAAFVHSVKEKLLFRIGNLISEAKKKLQEHKGK